MKLENYLIENQDLVIRIKANPQILKLFSYLSFGWELKEYNKSKFVTDCTLEYYNNKYCLKSKLFPRFKLKCHRDLISILNEFLIFISYFYTSQIKNFELLHCCAYQMNNENLIIFADHKVGKSEFCAIQLLNGAKLLADDLILYNKNTAEFKSLGFSIRLRRPVKENLVRLIKKDNFISGKRYSYINSKFVNLEKSGKVFYADNFYFLTKSKKLNQISLNDFFRNINNNKINIYKV